MIIIIVQYRKSNSTITNLLTYLDEISPLVASQLPLDTMYFDLSSAFGFVPPSICLKK